MRAGSHRRQVLLFFVAMIVPCLLLVVFSVRMVQQDADLAEKRRQDAQAQLLAEANRELLAQLEGTKNREIAALSRPAGRGSQGADPDVVFAAWVHDRRPVLPWDAAHADLLGKSELSRRVADAEQQEFGGGQLEAAVRSYEQALKLARTPAQSAYIRYLRARALEGTPRRGVGLAEFRPLLDAPIEAVDEDGIPVRLLAAERLLGAAKPKFPLF